uniref:Uncharacterized protein n=1 Tax=Hyaloperonospora arabidopsidis (strain Emoy2) TaxID=559515 RepID=M4C031_HYAAE
MRHGLRRLKLLNRGTRSVTAAIMPRIWRSVRSKPLGWRLVDFWCDRLRAAAFWIRKGGKMPKNIGIEMTCAQGYRGFSRSTQYSS